jgi:hypothetical protein
VYYESAKIGISVVLYFFHSTYALPNFLVFSSNRLANPTNFTKMGLWTLSQDNSDSSNPIAGILQKELAITPQQGRKVLEHRQKIQRVCMNLKEVREICMF